MAVEKIVVLGSGLMGSGIAQVAAQSGFSVTVRDVEARALEGARGKIEAGLAKGVKRGTLTEQAAAEALGKLVLTQHLEEALEGAEFVIEAVPENLALKRRVFEELDRLAPAGAVLASNTSELKIGSIASATRSPERVVGTHWFYPAHVMRLIEVVRGDLTSDQTLATTLDVCARLGKETVVCKDCQGFITSRIASVMIAECLRLVEEGIATQEDIDKAMKLGFNHPVGPFQLVDMSGVDIVYHALQGLTSVYGDRYRPTEAIAKLVAEGHLGQKTGRGFYVY